MLKKFATQNSIINSDLHPVHNSEPVCYTVEPRFTKYVTTPGVVFEM